MNLVPIATLISDAGLATPGVNLFVNMYPADVSLGVLLLAPFSGTKINYDLPKYRKGEFQAIVRVIASDFALGQTLIKEITDLLTIEKVTELDLIQVKRVHPLHEPVVYRVSAGNNVEFSVNFEMIYIITDINGY